MSEAGTLFKRYVWLIDTVQTGHWTKEDLMRKWLHSSLNDRQEEMADKTFHNHINAINNIFGLHIKCNKYGDKTYYIENENELDEHSDIKKWPKWLCDEISRRVYNMYKYYSREGN